MLLITGFLIVLIVALSIGHSVLYLTKSAPKIPKSEEIVSEHNIGSKIEGQKADMAHLRLDKLERIQGNTQVELQGLKEAVWELNGKKWKAKKKVSDEELHSLAFRSH